MKNYSQELLTYLDSKHGNWARTTIDTAYAKLCTIARIGFKPEQLFSELSEKGYSRYTIKTYFILARQFEEEVKKTNHFENWLGRNKLAFKNCYKKKNKNLTEEQYLAVLDSASKTSPDMYNFLILMSKAGLRKSEALSITWAGIKNDTLEVSEGKGGKQRFVPFKAEWLKLTSDNTGESIVSPSVRIQSFFKDFGQGFTPHDFRAYYATKTACLPGMSIEDVRDLLGHVDIRTTAKYLRADRDRQKRLILG